MRSFRIVLSAFAVVALAACGGSGGSGGAALPAASGGGGVVPPSSSARGITADGARTVSPDGMLEVNGSTVAFERGTVWVGHGGINGSATEFSVNANGPVAPLRTFGGIPWIGDPVAESNITDVAVAPDGTIWILMGNQGVFVSSKWRLVAFPPRAQNATPPNIENTYDGDGYPLALGLGGDGVMVMFNNHNDPTPTINTYPYAANDPAPIRTFHLPDQRQSGFALGNNGRIYLARSDGFESYRPESDGSHPLEHIVTAAPLQPLGRNGFAVGPDNSIFAIRYAGQQPNQTLFVDHYPRGSGTVNRSIGPLPLNPSPFATSPVITVDKKNRLYVWTFGKVYRFGPAANGNATPQRVIIDQTTRRASSIAIGP